MNTVEQHKEAALKALEMRKRLRPKQIRNDDLYAGSPMYFYCRECGHQSDVVPESYQPGPNYPKKLCPDCQKMKDKGWI